MCVFKYNASAYGSTQSNNTDVAECVQPAPTWPLNAKDVLEDCIHRGCPALSEVLDQPAPDTATDAKDVLRTAYTTAALHSQK